MIEKNRKRITFANASYEVPSLVFPWMAKVSLMKPSPKTVAGLHVTSTSPKLDVLKDWPSFPRDAISASLETMLHSSKRDVQNFCGFISDIKVGAFFLR